MRRRRWLSGQARHSRARRPGMYARSSSGMVPNMEIGAICDPTRRRRSRGRVPRRAVLRRLLEMLDSGDVDAVVPVCRHYLHPEMGIAALQRGIHALVEKPAGVYTKQVKELNAYAATKPELTFAIMFNQRNNPLYQRIKEIVDGGEIGKIRHTSWIITTWWRPQGYYDQSAWRATWGGEGGGVLVNQAPHQLDLWQWICGIPQSVYAKVAYGFRRDIAVEDEVTAVVDYGDGATGVFITAVHDLVGTDRFEILGDSGKIVVDNSKTATVTRLSRPERELSDGHGHADVMKLFTGQLDTDDYYSSEVIEFDSRGVPSTPACWRTSPRTFSTARHSSHRARTASTASGWRTPSTCPAGPAKRCRSDSRRGRTT